LNILFIQNVATPLKTLEDFLSRKSDNYSPSFSYPLGLMTLTSYARLRFSDLTFQIIDGGMEIYRLFTQPDRAPSSTESFLQGLLEKSKYIPDLVGIAVSVSFGHGALLRLLSLIKQKWPHTQIVLGGVHATVFAHRLIDEPAIDYIIRGAGELPFCALIDSLQKGIKPSNIPGLLTKGGPLETLAPPFANLDELPLPAYDLIDVDYYATHERGVSVREPGMRSAHIKISRGCFFRCTFCAGSVIHGRKVLLRSVDKIIEDIRTLITRFNINTIAVDDELFGFDKDHFHLLFQRIKETGLHFKFNFPHGFSVGILNNDLIDALAENGMDSSVIAIESGSAHVQKKVIKKNVDLEKAKGLAAHFRKRAITLYAFFMFGNPGEDESMMQETIRYARELPIDWAYFFIAYPFLGTEMSETLIKNGVLSEKDLLSIYDNTDLYKRHFDTPEISAMALNKLAYDANIDVNFFHNYNMRNGCYEKAIDKFSSVIQHYPFHIIAIACRIYCYEKIGQAELAHQDGDMLRARIIDNPEAARLFASYESDLKDLLPHLPFK